MPGQTVILSNERARRAARSLIAAAPDGAECKIGARLTTLRQRDAARSLIVEAPDGAVFEIKPARRTLPQNARMWAMLSDIARAKPEGRHWTAETWKAAFMHSLGHQVAFAEGLDGSGPFPLGFRSSRLTKAQMGDLMEVIAEYGARHGVRWSHEP